MDVKWLIEDFDEGIEVPKEIMLDDDGDIIFPNKRQSLGMVNGTFRV